MGLAGRIRSIILDKTTPTKKTSSRRDQTKHRPPRQSTGLKDLKAITEEAEEEEAEKAKLNDEDNSMAHRFTVWAILMALLIPKPRDSSHSCRIGRPCGRIL